GGIADTFVDAGGKTDAIFVFGKELTMQGNDGGAPVSVTAFGQGLGVNAGGGAPIALPPAVLQNRMSNSPTRAATNAALPSSGTNTIEQKMEQKDPQRIAPQAAQHPKARMARLTAALSQVQQVNPPPRVHLVMARHLLPAALMLRLATISQWSPWM
ncbi:MAG: hypothetical protein CMM93_08360, partial [Rickettsiales bacterium]|nr:hypothetical protein [Rickettsiales bacterium]